MNLFANAVSKRRARVLERLKGVALVAAAPVTQRNNDVEHEYRQDSDFYYLTGFDEPEAVLLMSTVHPEHRSVLFVRQRDPEREIWDGVRAGVEGAKEQCAVDACYPIEQLGDKLAEYFKGAGELVFEQGRWPQLDEKVQQAIQKARGRGRSISEWPRSLVHPDAYWHEMRLCKDELELDTMRKAAAITEESHRRAMAMAEPGIREYQIDAAMREVWLRNGAMRHAYPAIVGSGANATILHFRAGKRALKAGELVLIDAGCEYDYYACDVTRTFPVDGSFNKAQRAIYELVLAAQLEQLKVCVPGGDIEAIHQVGVRVITQGLLDLELLQGSCDELIESAAYRRFFMHRSSHWLGMDVHDVGSYFVAGKPRLLKPGMVLTIEPGIYIAANDTSVPEDYRGIGVRIEDDLLVTVDGHENLTAAIPKTVADVEQACRS